MTPLELSYPLTGLVLALGSGVYVWQIRRSLEEKLAQSQNSDQGKPLTASELMASAIVTPIPDAADDQSSQGETIHIKGKLRRLEKELEHFQSSLQGALAERDQLSEKYQSQEKMVAALQHQLAHYDDIQSEKFVGLQKLNQELLQENTNLSDRLKQAVNEVAETRPQLVRMQALETRNGQLTEQLNHVEQNQQKAIASRLETQEKVWQEKEQELKNQVTESEQRIQSLTTERDQARQSWQDLTEQSQSAQGQLETLQASLAQLTEAEKQWQGEKAQLNIKLNQLEDAQKSLALANAELKLKLETTQTQGDRLKAEKKEQATALQSAQGEIAQLQQQLADLEKAKVPEKVEELPAVEPVVELEPMEAVIVAPPPPQETEVEVELESVAMQVQPAEKPLVVEAEVQPIEEEIEVKPPLEEKQDDAPAPVKTETAKAEPSEKVTETPAPVKEVEIELAKTAKIPPAPVTPEPLPEKIVETETETTDGQHPLAEKKIVILGTLNAMNREDAKTRLQNVQAECTSAPSGKTDYVVVGKAPGAKLKKAQKLGIPQLSEAQFLELLGD